MQAKECSVKECQKQPYMRGYCGPHYYEHVRKPRLKDAGTGRRCSIEQCAKKHFGRGLCAAHYARLLRRGGLDSKPTQAGHTLKDRAEMHFSRGEGCWLWDKANSEGYGQISVNRRMRPAHVVVYELEVGPIPEGMILDHRCRVRNCVRPDHLRPVTNKQNLENLSGANRNNVTSGVRGVTWHKSTGKWVAQVGHNYKRYHVGLFDTVGEAEAAALAKRNELFTHNDADRRTP